MVVSLSDDRTADFAADNDASVVDADVLHDAIDVVSGVNDFAARDA
jgi:hypothetical protein